MRLDFASKAMDEVASTVDTVSRKLAGLSAPDLGTVYRDVSNDVCRSCGLRMLCWKNSFSDTMASFNDMTQVLREYGAVDKSQVTGHLARRCSRLDEVVRRVNGGYLEHVVREGAWRRLSEIRSVVTDQFESMSELLSELSEDFSAAEKVDADAAVRVIAVCEEHGLMVRDAVCFIGRGDRMTVEILASDVGMKLDESVWHKQIGDACGRDFGHPVVTRIGDEVKIALSEKPAFVVTVGTSQLNCSGEKLCGDSYETFSDGSGKLFAVLSDGMGSGGRAAVDGAMAAGLTTRLMQAGFGADSVLRMVNSALMVKSGDESLATLDIVSIDLFTGRMESLKAGAAISLLRSMGRVSRMERSSLPIGILRDIEFERSKDTLVDGDIVLMFSDGVMTDGIAWVEEQLRDFDPRKENVNKLAEKVAAVARQKQQGEHEDDITVIALMVNKVESR
jgi:stage II sporulation protein E